MPWKTGSREGSPGEQGMHRGRRICTFSNMMLWRPVDAHILGEETVYDFKPLPCVLFLFSVMAPRVSVTDPCEGEEGQGETLMVGCVLRYAHSEKGLVVSPRVSDLLPPPFFSYSWYGRGSGFTQGRAFQGTQIISRALGTCWGVSGP